MKFIPMDNQEQETQENVTLNGSQKQLQPHQKTTKYKKNERLFNFCKFSIYLIAFAFLLIVCLSWLGHFDKPIQQKKQSTELFGSNFTVTLLQNLFRYNQKNQSEVPMMRLAKDNQLSKIKIESAVKYTETVPYYKVNESQRSIFYNQLNHLNFKSLDLDYNIQKFKEKELGFCILLSFFETDQIQFNLNEIASILIQNYSNYKIVWPFTNQPKTEAFEDFFKSKQFNMSKSFMLANTSQATPLQNIYFGVKNYCQPGEIVVIINNVDFLLGVNVLSLFNAIYQSKESFLVYSQYLKFDYSKINASIQDFSSIIKAFDQKKPFKQLDFIGKFPLITFYTDLLLQVPIQALTDSNGNFYQDAWQNALFIPLFDLAGIKSYYLNEILYITNISKEAKIDKSNLKIEASTNEIRNKPQLKPLDQISSFVKKQSKTSLIQKKQASEDESEPTGDKSAENLLKNQENDPTISREQKPLGIAKSKIKEESFFGQPQTGDKTASNIQKEEEQPEMQKGQKQSNFQKEQTLLTPQKDQKKTHLKQDLVEPPPKQDLVQSHSKKDLEGPNRADPKSQQAKKSTHSDPQDLKEPILKQNYANDRNPFAEPKNIPKLNQDSVSETESKQEILKNFKNQHQQFPKMTENKKQQTVIVDGQKVFKSTEVLPVDESNGFLDVNEQEIEEFERTKAKDNQKQKKKNSFVFPFTKKIDVKGPNYGFSTSIDQMINLVDMEKIFGKKKSKQGIWKNQFIEAIKKLQITNNVKYGGQIEVDLMIYDDDKYEKAKRIKSILKTDLEYLDLNYKITEYKKKELPFCIVVPSFENIESGLYLRNLNSIFMQNYSNYHVVYVDDASRDKTAQIVKGYVFSRNIPLQKFSIIINKQNRKPPYNIYNAITNYCKLGQLAIIVEGDDALIGTNVLSLYNAIYQKEKCAMAYSSYLEIFQNSKVDLGVGHQIMDQYFQKNSIRSIFQMPGRYLLSFYVDVFKSIQVQQFKDPKGYFFWFAYDRALIYPLLEISYPRINIVKQIVYEHRRDSGKKYSQQDWKRESRQILEKKPYKPLKYFPFIERNKYKYFIDVPIQTVIENSDFEPYTFINNFEFQGICKDTHIKSIRLLELVHNVDFKGQINIELASYDTSKQEKYQRISKLLEEDKNYFNEKYDIDFYRKYELPFCIVTPSYNNVKSGLYLRNLDSIFMQDYKNYHIVYIDDCSPDKTGEFVKKYIEEKKIPSKHIKVIINKENKKALYNIHMGIHKYCKSGQIVMIIDGDDSFLGRNILSLYNSVYQRQNAAMAYSNFLIIHNNDRTQIGFCHDIDKEMFEHNTFRNSWDLLGTHLMSFYSDLFKKIKISDFTYANGSFFDYAYDRAIVTPLLQMAYPRISVIKEITYEYRNDTGINDAPDDWTRVSHLILDKKPYEHLHQFPFIKGLIISTDKFNIKAEIQTIIKNTNFKIYQREQAKKISGIAKEQHMHAIRLTELVHNINLEGKVVVSLKIKNVDKKRQRLEKLLQNDNQYIETKYKISQYKDKQLRFCILISSQKSVQNGLYFRNLNSIFMQDYKNYKVIFIDDNQPKQSEEYLNEYLEEQKIPLSLIKIIKNQQAKGDLSNYYYSAHNECELNSIVLIIGEKDALIGRHVLSVLNAKYQKQGVQAGFSCFLKVFNGSTELGTCLDIDPYYFSSKTFRNFLTYQRYRLMNFYNYLFRQIKIKDLTNNEGRFFQNAFDKAIMVPIIEMVFPNILIIKDIMYQDRFDEFAGSLQQRIETNLILSKNPYEKLKLQSD